MAAKNCKFIKKGVCYQGVKHGKPGSRCVATCGSDCGVFKPAKESDGKFAFIGVTCSKDLKRAVDNLADEYGMSTTKFVSKALEFVVEGFKKEK